MSPGRRHVQTSQITNLPSEALPKNRPHPAAAGPRLIKRQDNSGSLRLTGSSNLVK